MPLLDNKRIDKSFIIKVLLSIFTGIIGSVMLSYLLMYKENENFSGNFKFLTFCFFFVLVWIFCLIIIFHQTLVKRVEILGLLVMLSVGTLYVISMPVYLGISWDDQIHFESTAQLSHVFSGKLSVADESLISSAYMTPEEKKDLNTEDGYQAWLARLQTEYNSGQTVKKDADVINLNTLAYLPAAIGLMVGRLFDFPYYMIIILGRWFQVLVYSLIAFWGIRKLKSGKMIALTILLMPSNMFLATSFSYDPCVTVCLLYGFCCFIGELQQPEKQISWKSIILMILAFVVGFGPKAVYVASAVVLLLLPKQKFEKKEKYRKYMYLVLAAGLMVAATFVLPYILQNGGSVEDLRGGEGINATLQSQFIFSNGIAYIKILIKYLADFMSVESLGTYGMFFAYLGRGVYGAFYTLMLFIIAFTDKNQCDANVTVLQRVVMIGTCIISIALAATALYIAYTPVGANSIKGFQPRYLLPMAFPIMYSIGSSKIVNNIRRDVYNGVIIGICSLLLLNTLWTLVINMG